MKIVRALSVRQPWVELILRRTKKKEFRSTKTNIRERVYLYASRKPFDSPAGWRKVGKAPGELPVGQILGSVEIVGCEWDEVEQAFAYLLRNPVTLRKPLKATNAPGPRFWKPLF